jgi:hypothetical protein
MVKPGSVDEIGCNNHCCKHPASRNGESA